MRERYAAIFKPSITYAERIHPVSFVMNMFFEFIDIARLMTGENKVYTGIVSTFPSTLGESKLWIEFVISATAPVLALAATYLCARGGVKKAFVYGVVIVISASVFMLSRYVYEQQSSVRGYYWHELVLGAFLIMSYYLAASVSRGVFSSTLNEFFAAPRNTAQPVPAGE